ncbi:MAG: hypothetical protein GY842_25850 [bacterium]|nr:hypothetical protein [bacterium]
MLAEIESLFESNLSRVRNIVTLYDQATADGPGQAEVLWTDVLRGAVVLLHASLEDLLRSLAAWKLPTAEPNALESIPLEGGADPRRTRFSMPELAKHRGKTVDEVVSASIESYLERSSYGHPGEIKRLLEICGGDRSVVDSYSRWLGPMMERRHWIVHQVDRKRKAGPADQRTNPLQRRTVAIWIEQVEDLTRTILEQFR